MTVRADAIGDICSRLRSDHGFDMLVDICGVDFPDREPRFEVVYHLYSFSSNRRIRVKLAVDEGTDVPTVCGVWKAANWPEREVYDMFGIEFSGHPNLIRLLMPAEYSGHPLRKDYPLRGRGERDNFPVIRRNNEAGL